MQTAGRAQVGWELTAAESLAREAWSPETPYGGGRARHRPRGGSWHSCEQIHRCAVPRSTWGVAAATRACRGSVYSLRRDECRRTALQLLPESCNLFMVKKLVVGGGGGSRTHVRKNFQQRAFMLFHVHLCLVIDARNGRRNVDDQPDRSRPTRSDGAGKTSLLCDDRYQPVGEARAIGYL